MKKGDVFGRLTLLEDKTSKTVKCQCTCGTIITVLYRDLKSGHTKSCGCLIRELITVRNTKHKNSIRNNITPEYISWANMMTRCSNPSVPNYEYYGGRGISVCERWKDFSLFLEDMGLRPEGTSLDRIDTNLDYYKENCRWATKKEQMRNTRNNKFLELDGQIKTLAEWVEIYKTRYVPVLKRLRRGWELKRALETPIKSHR